MIAVGLLSWFALLYLILAILIWQDYRNDKILQELKILLNVRAITPMILPRADM